jgi:RNA polymerase sigma-70 factor, ECF subfamily
MHSGKANEEAMAAAEKIVAEESALVAAAQRGMLRAFEQLYRRQVGRVYALCLRMTGSPVEAEELTQETFVCAWEKLNAFRGESAFGTWLCRIAINAVLTHYRKGRRRALWEIEETNLTEVRVSTAVADPHLRMDLDAAIGALPPGARMVFVLHDVEGYRHEEIAGQTGMAVGTSKAHLHKARKLLREMMRS